MQKNDTCIQILPPQQVAPQNQNTNSSKMQIEVFSQSPFKTKNNFFEKSTEHQVGSSHYRETEERTTREGQYLRAYKGSKVIVGKAPALANTLNNSRVESKIRAKMVDWMLEVLQALQTTFSLDTYLRAILLMDIYVKYTSEKLGNEDILLIGLTCIYIASKYEDIYHIKILTLCDKASHGKYSPAEIRKKESDILKVLGYSISFASMTDLTDFYLIRIVHASTSGIFEELRSLCLHLICFCLHNVKFNNAPPHLLVVGCLIIAVRYDYSRSIKKSEKKISMEKSGKQASRDQEIIKNLVDLVEKKERKFLDELSIQIHEFLLSFERIFPESKQLLAYSKFQKNFLSK